MGFRKQAFFLAMGLVSIASLSSARVFAAQPKPGEGQAPAAPKGKPESANPPKTPSTATAAPNAEAAKAGSDELLLPGIELTVPKGWVREEVAASPMAPQAVFKLPKAEGDAEDGTVRITHFPSMKGKDEMNIERWIGQVNKPDGKPFSKEEAKVVKTEQGNVRLSVLDLTGQVRMTGWNDAKPNHRMIAAIVDHPQGPHYVVAGGGVKTMEKWSKDIDTFLKSAKVKKGE